MATNIERIVDLLLRLHRGDLTVEERQELDGWTAEAPERAALLEELMAEDRVTAELRRIDRVEVSPVRDLILQRASGLLTSLPDHYSDRADRPGRVRRLVVRWVAAAVLIGLLGLGVVWLVGVRNDSKRLETAASASVPDVAAPAGNKAVLTLGNGKRIILDSVASGAVAQQGNVQVVKVGGGKLAYKMLSAPEQGVQLYNTLENPRGSRVIDITLSDGSRVWLNAGSSLRYPALFGAGNREVEMEGEGYFEISRDAARPFFVQVAGKEKVEVLGTGFNINAYSDETMIRTTLLEGKVSVGITGGSGKAIVLQPGEQAVMAGDAIGKIKGADTALVMAWMNGRFAFNNADLPTVMRQLGRWYDVDVRYEGAIPERHFTGQIGQSLSLDQVLKGLTQARVHYTIEPGNKLVIRP